MSCGVLAVIFAAILVMICVKYRQIVVDKSVAEVEQKAISSELQIEVLIKEIETIATNIETQIKNTMSDPDELSRFYEQVLIQNKKLRGIGVGYEFGQLDGYDVCLLYAMYDSEGRIITDYYGMDNYCAFHDMDWYVRPKEEECAIWIDPYDSQINKTEVLTYSKPLYDEEGDFLGILALDLHLEDIKEFLRSEMLDFSRMLVGRHGEVIYSSDTTIRKINNIEEMAVLESDDRIRGYLNNMLRGENGRGRVMWNGQESVIVHENLADLGWSVCVIMPVDEIYGGVKLVMMMQIMAIVAFLTFLILIVIFIRSLSRTNVELVVARQKAEQADKMKSLFLANMSHEIRTPLNAIVGFADLLAQEGSNMTEEERGEFASVITKNNDLLLTLVNDILDLSKIESGNYQMKKQKLEINSICEFAVKNLQHMVAEGVELVYKKNIHDTVVIGDKERIGQVLMQFICNACKHTKSGSITVSCKDEGKKIRISVIDTGKGIKEKDLPYVFERFYKGESAVSGTGLGLSISQKIVELWQGEIGVESEYGKGATFWFTLNK